MSDFKRPWYIAGGWAVDLYLGYVSREHGDIEILVYREDQTCHWLFVYLKKASRFWQEKVMIRRRRITTTGRLAVELNTVKKAWTRLKEKCMKKFLPRSRI